MVIGRFRDLGITFGGSSGISHRLHGKTNPESQLQPVSFSFVLFVSDRAYFLRPVYDSGRRADRCGLLGDVPNPLGGDRVPLFSVDNSGLLLLNGQRLSSYFQFCLRTPGGLFLLFLCLSVWLSVLSYCLC